jgi:hypothetical protein
MRSLLRVGFFLGFASFVWAQAVSTSEIKGTVQDSSGSAVPGAEVKVTQTGTGLIRTVITGTDGGYTVTDLPPGPYQLEAVKEGFSKYVQTGIVLQVASNPTIDVSLKVGSVNEQVQVEANAAMVETQNTGVGTVIDSQRIVDLPLVGRQVQDLITFTGSATQAADPVQLSARNYPNIQSFSVAGGLANGITYVLDGATHNDVYTMANMPLPFPDALQEFKVETGALPAQYGMHSAAAVNAVTKSGTNEFHGAAFEFNRNYKFNARQYFSPTVDSLKRNQFGGTLGGPVRKNKLFFFGAYQATITRQSPNNVFSFVPTPAEIKGDFTAIAAPGCNSGRQITLRAPFVNNQIAPSLFSAPALNIAAKLPQTADPCGKTTYGAIIKDDENFGVGKVDYQLSATHSIFARYLGAHDGQPVPYNLSGGNLLTTGVAGACVCQSSTSGIDDYDQVLTLGDTYLIGSGIVNSFRATMTRVAVTKQGASFFGPQDVGINNYSAIPDFLNITVTGAFAIGNSLSASGKLRTTALHFSDDIAVVRGKHQMGFGVTFGGWDSNVNGNVFAIGNYTFNGQATGLAVADYFIGSLTTLNQAAPNTQYERDSYVGLYGQDSWKVKPGLTVNFGLRWEPFFPLQLSNGQIAHFDMGQFLNGTSSTVFKNSPAGLSFPGDPGFPGKAGMGRQWKQFMPRVGIVWDPKGDGKMSIRASYGTFYDRPPTEYHLNTTTEPPYGARTILNNPAGGFANPWLGYPGGNPFPYVLNPAKPYYPTFGTFNSFGYDAKMPNIEQWTLSIQRQFGTNWLASVNYMGNQMLHLLSADGANPGTFLGTQPCAINGISYAVCSTLQNLNQRRMLNLMNPAQGQYFGTITQQNDGGTGNYNGLKLDLQRRFSRGITMSANYTWSHCISNPVNNAFSADNIVFLFPNNRALDRGNCNTSGSDRRHIANMTAVGEMPRFSDKWMRMLVSGWRGSATAALQSGSWVTVTSGVDQAMTGFGGQRPNQVLADASGNGTPQRWFNPAAFALPAPGSNGNAGLGILEGPGILIFNAGLSRIFNVRERKSLELRAEAQNALNHTNFNNPSAALNSATYGQITSSGPARVMQFGLKYVF